jgi:two-component system phosphate regulon sensor histidine kinase PhoR
MVRLRRVWKLYIFYTTVLIVIMALAGFVLQNQLRKRLQAHLREDVLTLAKVIARTLPDTQRPSLLGPWCREHQSLADVRVTVMTSEGKVIGDSTGEAVAGDVRLNRPEVEGALKDGKAAAIRQSETMKADMLYVAVYVKEKGKVLRLGMPMTKVMMIENEVMGFLALVLFLIPILAIVFSYVFARHITPPEERYTKRSRTQKH